MFGYEGRKETCKHNVMNTVKFPCTHLEEGPTSNLNNGRKIKGPLKSSLSSILEYPV
jgi:hypothetical protein